MVRIFENKSTNFEMFTTDGEAMMAEAYPITGSVRLDWAVTELAFLRPFCLDYVTAQSEDPAVLQSQAIDAKAETQLGDTLRTVWRERDSGLEKPEMLVISGIRVYAFKGDTSWFDKLPTNSNSNTKNVEAFSNALANGKHVEIQRRSSAYEPS